MAFDRSTLIKKLNKTGITTEVADPDFWLSSGNAALNFNLCGRFNVGIPNKRSVLFWGPNGSGKSMFACLAGAEAQKAGYHIIMFDSEEASESTYLAKAGIDTSPEKFTPIRVDTIEQATEAFAAVLQSSTPTDKLFFLFDSLTNLETDKEKEAFDKGEASNDQGLFAKKLKLFMKNVNNKIGNRDCFFVGIAHCYENQDIRNGKGQYIVSGGGGFQFIPSMAVLVTKKKLKSDDGKDVDGVIITTEITKSRFNKLGGKVALEVPWETGVQFHDGLLDLAVKAGLVSKNGGWYNYTDFETGEVIKFQRSKFEDHYRKLFDMEAEEIAPEEAPE